MINNVTVTGWQDQPEGRGTFDILKTCGGTILLLCWSSVCPGVPGVHSGRWRQFVMKFNLFALAILGPDFIFMIALGQLNAAWRAKKAFHRDGHVSWSLRHCFFANMGGIHLQFEDRETATQPSFPVDCEQLLFLVSHKYLDLPEILEQDIDDRNKADDLARTIATVQTLWFTINSFGRISQGLHLTTLELTTLAFALLMTACSICWWRKPMSVLHPIVVNARNTSLRTILREYNAPAIGRGLTPLSFLNRHEWFMSQFWTAYMQILRNMHLVPERKTRPTEAGRFPSIDFPETDMKWEIIGGLLIPLYSSMFMVAWNFPFPTYTERLLWRIASVMSVAYGVLGAVLAGSWHQWCTISKRNAREPDLILQEEQNQSKSHSDGSRLASSLRRISQWFDWMRNLSPDNDPSLAVPARLYLLTTLLCVVYCFSRAFILIEDLIGLRSLPGSAYQTVDWGRYSPIL